MLPYHAILPRLPTQDRGTSPGRSLVALAISSRLGFVDLLGFHGLDGGWRRGRAVKRTRSTLALVPGALAAPRGCTKAADERMHEDNPPANPALHVSDIALLDHQGWPTRAERGLTDLRVVALVVREPEGGTSGDGSREKVRASIRIYQWDAGEDGSIAIPGRW